MAITPSYPGVYIQEIPSGVRTIMGVSTGIALFIGRTGRGKMNEPTLCLNYSDFVRNFSDSTEYGEMPYAVGLFFANGGTQCYVMRIAAAGSASAATVALASEVQSGGALVPVMMLTADEDGLIGEDVRFAVDYNTPTPEATFNLSIFRWETRNGVRVQVDNERWVNLSMDSKSPRYAPTYITQNSKLVGATTVTDASLPAGFLPAGGSSQSGLAVNVASAAAFRTQLTALLGTDAAGADGQFALTVNGQSGTATVARSSYVIDTGTLAAMQGSIAAAFKSAIEAAIPPGTTVTVAWTVAQNNRSYLQITASAGDIFISPAANNDLSVPLMLGADNGGLEISRYANKRPAPTGILLRAPSAFALLPQNSFNKITIGAKTVDVNLVTSATVTDPMVVDASGKLSGLSEKLDILAKAINDAADSDMNFKWQAQSYGTRIVFIPTGGNDNLIGTIALLKDAAAFTTLDNDLTKNVRYYTLGKSGNSTGYQVSAANFASDGTVPSIKDYTDTTTTLSKEVDLFNLMVIPGDVDQTSDTRRSIYAQMSVYCQQRRALLLVDAPSGDWLGSVQTATGPDKGVRKLNVGMVKDHAALFYPRVLINDGGLLKPVGVTGAIAGLMARVDGSRGVWKAPAGTEADIRGIEGVEYRFSDGENGVLNPRGINVVRSLPVGVVNWGARTMDGDDNFASDWKYIPIRRLALYIEESLYRGTQWVVFEPNDEPLWRQIRLNIGAFMHNLFRQGAFQGSSPNDAYLVKCDAETTTQNDRNMGVVNILVGFAPLKPAEFVIISIQQLAGQIQT